MGIAKYIADIPAVNVHQCDTSVLYPDEFLVESVVIGTGVAGLSDIFVAVIPSVFLSGLICICAKIMSLSV